MKESEGLKVNIELTESCSLEGYRLPNGTFVYDFFVLLEAFGAIKGYMQRILLSDSDPYFDGFVLKDKLFIGGEKFKSDIFVSSCDNIPDFLWFELFETRNNFARELVLELSLCFLGSPLRPSIYCEDAEGVSHTHDAEEVLRFLGYRFESIADWVIEKDYLVKELEPDGFITPKFLVTEDGVPDYYLTDKSLLALLKYEAFHRTNKVARNRLIWFAVSYIRLREIATLWSVWVP